MHNTDASFFPHHGTQCAGCAGAKGDNIIGVSGTAPNVKVRSIRANYTDSANFILSTCVEAIKRVVDLNSTSEFKTPVVSMSLGFLRFQPFTYQPMKDLADYLIDKNVLLVVSAGNESKIFFINSIF